MTALRTAPARKKKRVPFLIVFFFFFFFFVHATSKRPPGCRGNQNTIQFYCIKTHRLGETKVSWSEICIFPYDELNTHRSILMFFFALNSLIIFLTNSKVFLSENDIFLKHTAVFREHVNWTNLSGYPGKFVKTAGKLVETDIILIS